MKVYMKAFFGHIRNILVHKWWVFYYACKFGIPWRGFMHDWSKFHPTEFWESVKYYQGDKSPIPVCKAENGVSYAWQHHKGHNPHHYEYWTDNFDGGGKPTYHKIPYEYLMEMLADWFAAGRTYVGKKFTLQHEVAWWYLKRESIAIHPATIEWIDQFMKDMEFWDDLIWVSDKHNQQVLKNRLKNLYERN
jgi:hypothetical protein